MYPKLITDLTFYMHWDLASLQCRTNCLFWKPTRQGVVICWIYCSDCFKVQGHLVPRLHCETAQFWARYMGVIPMVLTLIRATRKTTLNCMSALSVCLVPNVHCTWSHQLRTIGTCATDCLIHIADAKNFWNKIGLVCHNHWFFPWEMFMT